MSARLSVTSLRSIRLVSVLALLASLGCGASLYEQRLAESRQYFAYMEKLDTNLAPRMKLPPIEEIRVPLQFRQIPAPQPVARPKGEEESDEPPPEPVDLRQPNYVNLELPGLIGAWEAQLPVFADGSVTTKGGYIYALTNVELLQSGERAKEAPLFTRDLRRLVSAAFAAPLDDPEAHGEPEAYPRSKIYLPQNKFLGTPLQPAAPIDGVPYLVELASLQNRDVQVVLLVVVPRDVESGEKLTERIPLMFETLKIASEAPRGGTARSSGGAPPPAGGGGF